MANFEKISFSSGGNLYKKEEIALLAQLFNINIFKNTFYMHFNIWKRSDVS